jgi:hypothetical protein
MGDIVDSNLDDEHGPSLSLKGVRQRLSPFRITPPTSLLHDLAVDRHAHAGHRRIVYNDSGDEIMVAMAPLHAAPQGPGERHARLQTSQEVDLPAGQRRSFTSAAGGMEPRRGRSFPGRFNQLRGERSTPCGWSVRPRYR